MKIDGREGESLVNPKELDYLLESVLDVQPITLVEIGTFEGATAAHIAKSRPKARVICIDPFPPRTPENVELVNPGDVTRWMANRQPNMNLFVGTAMEFLTLNHCRYFADIVFVDGDHRTEAVYADMLAAEIMLRGGGVILAHDYNRLKKTLEEEVKPGIDRFCQEQGWAVTNLVGTIVRVEKVRK
jgi:predicted O-methyltransferase YrrM